VCGSRNVMLGACSGTCHGHCALGASRHRIVHSKNLTFAIADTDSRRGAGDGFIWHDRTATGVGEADAAILAHGLHEFRLQ
jgi:hypothetical protein